MWLSNASDSESSASSESEALDKKQRDVAYAMVRSGMTIPEILALHSVTDEEFIMWIRGGRFTEYAASLARGFAEADAPYVWTSLLSLAKGGSVPAIRLYFDMWKWNKKPAEPFGSAGLDGLRGSIFSGGGVSDGRDPEAYPE